MATHNIIIVGAGLFGSIAATLARKRGHAVTVIDNKEKYAASKASGCVLAPSWLSSLDSEQVEGGMRVLNDLYTVEPVAFPTKLGLEFKAMRVNPDKVLVKPDMIDSVLSVGNGFVVLSNRQKLSGKVLVAAGVWSDKLVTMPKIRGLYGASVRYTGVQLASPVLSVYQPYRQAVGINLDKKTVWFGDGTALIQKTWLKEEAARVTQTTARSIKLLSKTACAPLPRIPAKTFVGCRPYVEGHKAGYFERYMPNTWVSTGGAKNGTILAAWQALRFVEGLR